MDNQGNEVWKFDYDAEKANFEQIDPYTLEHVNLINSIRKGQPIEQASETAVSNMAAIMDAVGLHRARNHVGRDDGLGLDYTPADLKIGQMDMSGYTVPVPEVENKKNDHDTRPKKIYQDNISRIGRVAVSGCTLFANANGNEIATPAMRS